MGIFTGMMTDYRVLFLFAIPIVLNAVFIIRRYYETPRRRSRYSYEYDSGASRDFQWWEAVISLGIFFIVLLSLWSWGVDNRISNYQEQIGGYVTAHYAKDGSHEESHQTCSGSGKDETCTTWYETVYDRTFFVDNNIGEWTPLSHWHQTVDKPNRNSEPYFIPLFYQETFIGKPVSFDNSYVNYIAAANEDYFKNTYQALAESFPDICPETPDIRFNDISVIKVIPVGFASDAPIRHDVYAWNFYSGDGSWYTPNVQLSSVPLYADTLFGYLGAKVQGDIHVYIFNSQNRLYADMCMAKWKNGAKNSIYVFIFGESNGTEYHATDVVSLVAVDGMKKNTGLALDDNTSRSNYYMKEDIRNQLLGYFSSGGTLDRENVLKIISSNVDKTFVRQEMANFKKLKDYIVPTNGWIIGMFFIMTIVDTVVHLYFANNEM